MASKKVNIANTDNKVTVTNSNNKIEVIDTNVASNIEVTRPVTAIVEVKSPKPSIERIADFSNLEAKKEEAI